MKIIKIDGGQVYEVQKYTKSGNDGEESVWCNEWYGRHVIGKDCCFFTDKLRESESLICQSCNYDGKMENHCPYCGNNFPN
jgi:hypothetical protein